jgi:hypothetical protein
MTNRSLKTSTASDVSNGCETWFLAMGEEYMLRVLENGVLGEINGPKTDEVTGEWRKLHNQELRDWYC